MMFIRRSDDCNGNFRQAIFPYFNYADATVSINALSKEGMPLDGTR
jgi:hypothetical protein